MHIHPPHSNPTIHFHLSSHSPFSSPSNSSTESILLLSSDTLLPIDAAREKQIDTRSHQSPLKHSLPGRKYKMHSVYITSFEGLGRMGQAQGPRPNRTGSRASAESHRLKGLGRIGQAQGSRPNQTGHVRYGSSASLHPLFTGTSGASVWP